MKESKKEIQKEIQKEHLKRGVMVSWLLISAGLLFTFGISVETMGISGLLFALACYAFHRLR